MVIRAAAAHRSSAQRGLVLIVTLLLLLVMGVIASLATENAVSQLRMAGNEQQRVTLLQRALSVVDAVLQDPDASRVKGGEGYRMCGPGSAVRCDEHTLELQAGFNADSYAVDFYLTRVGPLSSGLPYRSEHRVSSAAAFDLVRQELTVSCGAQGPRRGRVELVQGMLFGVPAAQQTGVFSPGVAR